ncbi:MAG TPA: Gfo/Idh/MocA family oxidoreductase [Candidatus Limnocylindrales bacterium]|nr:Gfo/Idh/MocA family oxidoreductase [Candidatus Limnocylindrales bacterium]
MPPSPSVRLGIVGCGNVLGAYLALAEMLRREGVADVTVFCGREHQRFATLAAWPSAAFVTHFEDFVSRPDVDAIVVLTPMVEHARMARAALEAGKHVLVEKPLAVTLKEARQLIAVAKATEKFLVCAPFTVLSPTFQAIGRRLQRGDIGTIISARGRYGWAGPDWTGWFYRRGGGAIFDLGVYNLTTLTGWLGPVRRVAAMSGVAVPKRSVCGKKIRVEADDNSQILLDFDGNRFAVITTGFTLQQYRGPGLELFGLEGTLYLLGDDWDPDGYELWQNSAGCWQTYKETHPEWPWTDGLRHMVECIRTGLRPAVMPEHAYHVLEVMLAAQAAGRDGRTRNIKSRFKPLQFRAARQHLPAHRVHDRTRVD